MSAQRLLIINADDFGYNDAITRGILSGYRNGLVTSTTAMVNIEGAVKRIAAAHAEEPRLPVGLHLNLTTGRPVLPPEKVPHLVRADGTFYHYRAILPRLAALPLEEVRAELRAQAAALANAGVAFDHIDYHHHVLAYYTPLFNIIAEIAWEYRVPVRQPAIYKLIRTAAADAVIASKRIGFWRTLRSMGVSFLRHPLSMMKIMLQKSPAQRRQIAASVGTTDAFIMAFYGNPTLENFILILDQLPIGLSEIMTHPAEGTSELFTMPEHYRHERAKELAVLTDPRAREAVQCLGIHLVNFSYARAAVNAEVEEGYLA